MKFDLKAIDQEIAGRIKLERLRRGYSQSIVGEDLDVTFQQMQKYETGTNRISGSKLAALTKIYDVPLGVLIPDLSSNAVLNRQPSSYDFSNEALKLLRAFDQIKDPAIKQKILALCAAYNAATSK